MYYFVATLIAHLTVCLRYYHYIQPFSMIDLTTSDTAPDNFFDDGDWVWVDAALPPLTRQQKSFIPSVLDKILTEANFNKKQVDVINEYWKKTTSTTMEDEVILCAAYRAG